MAELNQSFYLQSYPECDYPFLDVGGILLLMQSAAAVPFSWLCPEIQLTVSKNIVGLG